jgi:hypothetical protein
MIMGHRIPALGIYSQIFRELLFFLDMLLLFLFWLWLCKLPVVKWFFLLAFAHNPIALG